MPKRPSKNVTPKLIEMPNELVAEVDAYAEARSQTFKDVVLRALRRHLDNPPPMPPPEPPLPPAPPEPPGAKRGRGRPKKQ